MVIRYRHYLLAHCKRESGNHTLSSTGKAGLEFPRSARNPSADWHALERMNILRLAAAPCGSTMMNATYAPSELGLCSACISSAVVDRRSQKPTIQTASCSLCYLSNCKGCRTDYVKESCNRKVQDAIARLEKRSLSFARL